MSDEPKPCPECIRYPLKDGLNRYYCANFDSCFNRKHLPLSDWNALPREDDKPADEYCPDCGGKLTFMSDEVIANECQCSKDETADELASMPPERPHQTSDTPADIKPSKTIDELAKEQGVKPVDIEQIYGVLPDVVIDDPITAPAHYTWHPRGIECRDIIGAFPFHLGAAIKYIWRAGRKGDAIEDLQKAIESIKNQIKEIGND